MDRIRSLVGFARPAILIATFCLVIACSPAAGDVVADELRSLNHPIVQEVIYDGDNDGSGPVLEIVARPGTTFAEALEFGCDAVMPALERHAESLPPNLGWHIYEGSLDDSLMGMGVGPCPQ